MLTIRRAIPSDTERISHLYSQLVSNPALNVSPERVACVSEDPNAQLLVAEDSGQVIGTALVSLCQDVMFGSQPFAVVENVVVDSDARSKGVGAALMRHVEAFAKHKNCSKIMLLSSVNRVSAHRFFERAGFNALAKRAFVKYSRDFGPKA